MNDGSVVTRQVTVNVTPVVGAPTIGQFSMTPPSPITLSQCFVLQWSIQGTTSNVRVYRNNNLVWDSAPIQGSYQDCPPSAGQYNYLLQAIGPGGTTQANQFLQVNANQPTATPVSPTATPVPPTATPVPPTATPVPPTPTPVPPTPTPVPQPQIFSFAVDPGEIQPGQCVTVNWNAGGGAVSVDITRGGDLILDNGSLSGSQQDCPPGSGMVNYTLTASNQAGTTVSQSASVNVTAPPPPLVGSWTLVTMLGNPVTPGTTITANFDNGQLSGSGGCNTYNTTYTTSGNSISIGFPTTTQVACEDDIIQQENIYFNVLTSSASYQLSGPTLAMFDGGGQLVLQYSGAR
jgi:heat shock protein HslJ